MQMFVHGKKSDGHYGICDSHANEMTHRHVQFGYREVAKGGGNASIKSEKQPVAKEHFQVVGMVSHLLSVSINMTTAATTPYF